MPTLDIFNDDAFSVASLTTAISEQPYVPGRLGELGLFESDGITTTTAQVEKRESGLGLVPAGVRGQSGDTVGGDTRQMIPVNAVHLPERSTILADEIQNVRAFGSETETEQVQRILNRRLAKMRRQIDATLEFQRAGAIKGKILDADGSTVLLDIFDAFGLSQQVQSLELDQTDTDVRQLIMEAKRLSEDALGAAPYSGMRALCGDGFFDSLISHSDVKEAYQRYQDGEMLRNDPRGGFPFAGVQWEEYRASVGGQPFIASDEAYLVPEGVPDMFGHWFAPADYMETVNTMGLPYYAKVENMDFNKGANLEAQSNPVTICTRPRAVIKLTIA